MLGKIAVLVVSKKIDDFSKIFFYVKSNKNDIKVSF